MSNSLEAPSEEAGRPRVLLALTGSVASVKAEALVRLLLAFAEVRVVASAHSLHFFDLPHLRTLVPVYLDEDEWKTYSRGDPVLHIELRKWADCLLIAPLSANSLAEIALGLCPNLVVRHLPHLTTPAPTPAPARHPGHHTPPLPHLTQRACLTSLSPFPASPVSLRRAWLARGTSLSRCCWLQR